MESRCATSPPTCLEPNPAPNPTPNQAVTGTCPDHVYECSEFTDAPLTTDHYPLKFCCSAEGLQLHITNMDRVCVVRHEQGTIVRTLDGTFVGMRLPETLSAEVRS